MTISNVTWLRPRRGPDFTDIAALNDIHALLTASPDPPPELLAGVSDILARTGRPMVAGRDIEARITASPIGWPVAEVDADDTTLTIRQDPASTGLLIEITTRNPAERDRMTVTLDGRCLHHPRAPGGHAA
jgi:hypothetical protein